jgi:hypothetical protein
LYQTIVSTNPIIFSALRRSRLTATEDGPANANADKQIVLKLAYQKAITMISRLTRAPKRILGRSGNP